MSSRSYHRDAGEYGNGDDNDDLNVLAGHEIIMLVILLLLMKLKHRGFFKDIWCLCYLAHFLSGSVKQSNHKTTSKSSSPPQSMSRDGYIKHLLRHSVFVATIFPPPHPVLCVVCVCLANGCVTSVFLCRWMDATAWQCLGLTDPPLLLVHTKHP